MKRKPMKEELREVIVWMCEVVKRLSAKENATPEELTALAEIADSITKMTGFAIIEEK